MRLNSNISSETLELLRPWREVAHHASLPPARMSHFAVALSLAEAEQLWTAGEF